MHTVTFRNEDGSVRLKVEFENCIEASNYLKDPPRCDFCGKEAPPGEYFCCAACEREQFDYNMHAIRSGINYREGNY